MRKGGGTLVRVGGSQVRPAVCGGPSGNPNCGGSRRRSSRGGGGGGFQSGSASTLAVGNLGGSRRVRGGGRGGNINAPVFQFAALHNGGSRKWIKGGDMRLAVCGGTMGNANCGRGFEGGSASTLAIGLRGRRGGGSRRSSRGGQNHTDWRHGAGVGGGL
jgi:hypothetical protein